jgi:predicted transcriptional regulator
MLTKDKIKKTIDLLPESVTIDELIDRIIVLDKIEQGLNDVENGNTFTSEEVVNKLEEWLK